MLAVDVLIGMPPGSAQVVHADTTHAPLRPFLRDSCPGRKILVHSGRPPPERTIELHDGIVELVEGPTSAVIATVGDHGQPVVSRLWGAHVTDADRVRVLADPDAPELQMKLAPGRPVAMTFASCVDYASVQLKGQVVAIDAGDRAGDARLRSTYRDGFVAVNIPLGFPAAASAAMQPVRWFGVLVEVTAVYDQTPRPGAGQEVAPP